MIILIKEGWACSIIWSKINGKRGDHILFQDWLNIPFDTLLEDWGPRVVWIKDLLGDLRASKFRWRVRHQVISHIYFAVSIVRDWTNTSKLTNGVFLLWIWEEAFIEFMCRCFLLIITQMLCKSYFENKSHEILYVINLNIKFFLGQRLVHQLKGQIRQYWHRFVLRHLWRQLSLILLAPLLKYVLEFQFFRSY